MTSLSLGGAEAKSEAAYSSAIEIEVPPSNSTGYWVWLDASWSASSGMTALSYGHGTQVPDAIPGNAETGAPPPKAYQALFYVTSMGDRVDAAFPLVKTSLSLHQIVVDVNCQTKILELQWERV